jgi:exonuclease III
MMQHHQPPRPFKVAAVNVNGLVEKHKRQRFFAWLQQQRYAVALLSETHCTSAEQAQHWVREGAGHGKPWQGAAMWANQEQQGGRAAGGVAVLLSDSICGAGTQPVVEHQTPSGRVLKVSWDTPWGQRLAAAAVYAPCTQQDRADFFLGEYLDAVTSGTQQGLMVGGDFNCAMRPEDVKPLPGQQPADSSRMVGGVALQVANRLAGLQDSWLQLHPHKLQLTHRTHHTSSGSSHPDVFSGGRIDYVFLSQDLVDGGWLKSAHQHSFFPSDHRPVDAKLQPPDTPDAGPKRWRFPNHMLGVQDFVDQLRQRLSAASAELQQRTPRLNPAEEWEQLKLYSAQVAQQLERQHRFQQQQELRRLRQQLAAARGLDQREPSQGERRQMAAEQALSAFQHAQLQQQVEAAEPLYELYGEKPSYWFYQLGKTAPEQQYIAEVMQQNGTTVAARGREGVAAAARLLADYYDPATGGLFSCHPTDRQQQDVMLAAVDMFLSAEEQQQCEGEQEDGTLTEREAHAALARLPRGKSPGSDGLTYEFYTAVWDVVGAPLVAAFNYSFQQPQLRLSEQQRLGLITLIYKGGGKPRADPASYRPITLLNCDLKIVANTLAQRFGAVLDSVIDSTQTAFVPGRDIADNVLLHLEEIDYLQEVGVQQGQQGCILFLDFEKAYDRLDRDWLVRCMETMQFPDSSIRWVRLLLAGTCGQLIFNGGYTSRVFDIPSGCAQGSPLSPLLYVIAAQPLAAKCRQLQRDGSFTSISMPDGSPAPCCHQHADDTTLHAETVDGVRTLLQQAVEPFCAASGAKLNVGKSKGMVLGAHPALVGQDAETGVVLVDTAVTPIRHLGVLLSVRGTEAFATQLFQQRLSSITHRARVWSRCNLTLLGRCEVARQVMASCLVYHAQFVGIPADMMQLIQRRISAFVLGLGCIRQDNNRQLRWRPSQAVASLQPKQGGIACVDVQAHVTAMQAKVAAALLHPHKRAWKAFMQASLERAAPGVGLRLLVQQLTGQAAAAVRRRLNPRHAMHVAAFQELGLHRSYSHARMSVQQLHLEPVVGNHSIASAVTGGMFTSARALPNRIQPRTAGVTLGQVAPSLSFQPAVDGMVLPAAWQHTLQQQQQQQLGVWWEIEDSSRWAQQHVSSSRVDWYEVQQDNNMVQLDMPPELPDDAAFQQCCVVLAPPPGSHKRKQQQQQGDQEQSTDVYYLVGRWEQIQVDPSAWRFAPNLKLLEFSVREATRRLVQFRCRSLPGWVPGWGVRPRVWRDTAGHLAPDTGLQQLEAKHKRSFADMLQGGFSNNSSSSGQRITTADQLAAYDAVWMHSSQERQHVMQRVAARDAAGSQPTGVRLQQQLQHVTEPAVDDTKDPLDRGLQPASQADAPWAIAYRRACDKRLPRQLRVFGWQLLHAAVNVGAGRVYAATSSQELLRCCCQQPQCQPQQQQQHQPEQPEEHQQQQQQPAGAALGSQQPQQQPQPQPQVGEYQLETLSHMFVQCPVAAAAWAWFAGMWRRAQPGVVVDVSSIRLLLLDDYTVFCPPPALQWLWTYLRLLMLQSIWVVRSESEGKPYSSSSIISRFLAALQQQLKQDWARTQGDIRVNSGVPLGWLKGCNPIMSQQQFEAKWQRAGVLYVMVDGEGPRVCVPR